MRWTVLNRDDATEVTKAVRQRWPHSPGLVARRRPRPRPTQPGRSGLRPDVRPHGSTRCGTIAGVVRDAMTGRPVPKAVGLHLFRRHFRGRHDR